MQIKLSFIGIPWYTATTFVISFPFFWSAAALMASRTVCFESEGYAPFSLLNSSSQLSNCSITDNRGDKIVRLFPYNTILYHVYHRWKVNLALIYQNQKYSSSRKLLINTDHYSCWVAREWSSGPSRHDYLTNNIDEHHAKTIRNK